MARDNFKAKVIEQAYKRVAGRCSNPECRVPTFGPVTERMSSSNIGEAAHIYAASPGGPRYRGDMSSNQRRDFENAIWLCANCAAKIDRDVVAFPAKLLMEWKQQAEHCAQVEQGRQLPKASDSYEQVAMALAGKGSRFMPQAISNTHMATKAHLESLDPRLAVHSEFVDGQVRFNLFARETVPIKARIGPESAEAWAQGLTTALDRGKSVKLPMLGVKFEGSKLLEAMFEGSEQGTLIIAPVGRPAVVKFFVPQKGIAISEDVNGVLVAGSRALHFEGCGYGGLVNLEIDFERLLDDLVDARVSYSFSWSVWQGVDANNPAYLDKVLRLLDCLLNIPEQFFIHLEVNGSYILTGRNLIASGAESFEDHYSFAHYVERARSLTQHLNINVPIDCDSPYSEEDHKLLARAADVVKGLLRYTRDQLKEDPRITVVCSDGGQAVRALVESCEFLTLRYQSPGSSIRVFGQTIHLPSIATVMSSVRLHVESSRVLEGNMEFVLRAERGDDFLADSFFESE